MAKCHNCGKGLGFRPSNKYGTLKDNIGNWYCSKKCYNLYFNFGTSCSICNYQYGNVLAVFKCRKCGKERSICTPCKKTQSDFHSLTLCVSCQGVQPVKKKQKERKYPTGSSCSICGYQYGNVLSFFKCKECGKKKSICTPCKQKQSGFYSPTICTSCHSYQDPVNEKKRNVRVVYSSSHHEKNKIEEEDQRLDSKSEIELYRVGVEYQELSNYNTAIKFFKKVVEINPNHVDALFNLGYNYSELNKHVIAIKYYEKMLLMSPNDEDAWHNISMEYEEMGWDDFLEKKSNIWFLVGIKLFKEPNITEAISAFQESLEANPKNIKSLINLGTCFAKKIQFKKALQFFLKANQLEPLNKKALQNLAITYVKLNRLQDALDAFKKILQYYPNENKIKTKIKEIEEKLKSDVKDDEIFTKEKDPYAFINKICKRFLRKGINKQSSKAEKNECYRDLLKMLHPDQNRRVDEKYQDILKEINVSFDIILGKNKKKEWDD